MESIDSSTKKNFFPHDVIRSGQDELIKDIQTAFKEKKILLAHAPTGLGKTAGALSVAVEQALEHKKTIFFLTNRHTQHRIAVETLKKMKQKTGEPLLCIDLIGKKWMCNQDVAGLFGTEFNEYCKHVVEKGECEFYNRVHDKKEFTVEAKALIKKLEEYGPLHNEEVISHSKEVGMCSYEITLGLAKKANVIIGDYYYAFNPFVQSTIFAKLKIELEDIILVVDEGHNLPNRVTEMLSSTLTSHVIRNAVIEAKKFQYGGVIQWLQELMNVMNDLADFSAGVKEEKEKLVQREEFISKVKQVTDYDGLIDELELAADEIRKKQRKSYLGGIAHFLQSWKSEEEGFIRILTERESKYGPLISLSYDCLDPSIITKTVFNRVYAGLIMSGTLKPTFMYKDLLGIERDMEKEYSSPFPPENKLMLVIPETTTKFTLRGEEMFKRIADKCTELSKLIPGNVALFFPSYFVRDKVGNYFKSEKKLFWEKSEMSKEEKENFLEEFKSEREKGGVLLGVSGANFAEGVDLPGDLLNGVVVVGLPLGKPDLKTREVINYYEKKFGQGWDYGYIFPAMTKCIQSAGRCIRSETDKGAVIFLDERFAWERYYNCFPDRVGLRVTKEYEKLLRDFFERKAV